MKIHRYKELLSPRYMFEVSVVTVLYFLFAKLGDLLTFVEVFNHSEYPPYWPPSGVALALLLILGRHAWPGIVIASLFLLMQTHSFLDGQTANTLIIGSGFITGRVAEALTGHKLIQKWTVAPLFGSLKNVFYFIAITFGISLIGAGLSSSAIQIIARAPTSVYLT